MRALALSKPSGPTPTAAPTINDCFLSLEAKGNFSDFSISLTVIRPKHFLWLFVTISFSILCLCNNFFASVLEHPCLIVITFLVINSLTFILSFLLNLKSLLVIIPKTSLCSLTTGIPEIFFSFIIFFTSDIKFFGPIVIGFTTIPDSYFLTFKTSSTWDFIDMFLCKQETPPS